MSQYFPYGQAEIAHLSKRCKKLGQAIAEIGPLQRTINPDPFSALVSSIISQQISTKAAITITERLQNKCGQLSPGQLAVLSPEEIQSCGMSMRKASYIKGVADAALDGRLDPTQLARMSDEEVVKSLVALKGVGVWTAEMLMIFSLGRQDILSWLDLGIRRGLSVLYGYQVLSRERFEKHRRQYSPYGSVASFYLWHLAGLSQLAMSRTREKPAKAR